MWLSTGALYTPASHALKRGGLRLVATALRCFVFCVVFCFVWGKVFCCLVLGFAFLPAFVCLFWVCFIGVIAMIAHILVLSPKRSAYLLVFLPYLLYIFSSYDTYIRR